MGRPEAISSVIEILELVNLNTSSLKIHGDGEKILEVSDPAHPKGYREGKFFVSLPRDLTQVLPGSVISSRDFLAQIASILCNDYFNDRIMGHYFGNETNPAISCRDEGFSLSVFHGSYNFHALEITRLASEGAKISGELERLRDDGKGETEEFTDKNIEYQIVRGNYQQQVKTVMEPILKFKQDDLADPNVLRIVEDCLASGDTIAGVLTFLLEKRQLPLREKKIRIDVAVATTQGILVLKKFAQDNGLSLEINVGYLAYGLSEGEKKDNVRLHANYITYPQEILEQLPEEEREYLKPCKSGDGHIYVVGDMGDLFKSMDETFDGSYPWNSFRKDTHGDRKTTAEELPMNSIDPSKPTILFFANGGYFLRALWDMIFPNSDCNEIMLSAKRVWSNDPNFNYGVLVSDLTTI